MRTRLFTLTMPVAVLSICGASVVHAAPASETAAACRISDLRIEVKPMRATRGVVLRAETTAKNISAVPCAFGCRDNPVSVVVRDSRRRMVRDVGTLAADGCPADPTTSDGVVHWTVQPGETYAQFSQWDQQSCSAPGHCRPVNAGRYRFDVTWSRPDGAKTASRDFDLPKGPACPARASSSSELLADCRGITAVTPSSYPSTTLRVASKTSP